MVIMWIRRKKDGWIETHKLSINKGNDVTGPSIRHSGGENEPVDAPTAYSLLS